MTRVAPTRRIHSLFSIPRIAQIVSHLPDLLDVVARGHVLVVSAHDQGLPRFKDRDASLAELAGDKSLCIMKVAGCMKLDKHEFGPRNDYPRVPEAQRIVETSDERSALFCGQRKAAGPSGAIEAADRTVLDLPSRLHIVYVRLRGTHKNPWRGSNQLPPWL